MVLLSLIVKQQKVIYWQDAHMELLLLIIQGNIWLLAIWHDAHVELLLIMQGNMTFSYLTRCTHGITLDYVRKTTET